MENPKKIDYSESFKQVLIEFAPKIVTAILILIIGLWITRLISKTIRKVLIKRNIDETLTTFISNLSFWGLRILVFITVITNLGVPTSSLVAIMGAAGLAVGLALQGSLSNFAGGILIVLFKPFKLDDLIEAQGELGTVKEIQIFSTKLITPDSKSIYIPNGALSNGVIKNYTKEGIRRVDLIIGVDYKTDLKKAKEVIYEVFKNNPLVLNEPQPEILVWELADSSINLAVRPWTKAENYFDVHSQTLENCKKAFDLSGIEIPYPHQVEIKK